MRCNAKFYYGENPTYWYWAPVAAATRGFKMVLFTASRGNNFVGGKCVPPNALPVCCVIVVGLCYLGKYFAASTDMSPSSARPVSTGTYVNFSVLDVHSTRCRRPHSSSHMSRHAWTTATLYWRARRKRRRPTNCNEC